MSEEQRTSAKPTGGSSSPLPPEPFGGEVRVRAGAPPRWLRWFNYALYLFAIVYMVVNRGDEGSVIVLAFVAVTSLWLVYIVATRRPPEP